MQKMMGFLNVAGFVHAMSCILKRLEHDGLQNLVVFDQQYSHDSN
jgi:hypothetical protein